jgi:hypothetical protein
LANPSAGHIFFLFGEQDTSFLGLLTAGYLLPPAVIDLQRQLAESPSVVPAGSLPVLADDSFI